MDPRKVRYGFSLAELDAGARTSSSDDDDDADDAATDGDDDDVQGSTDAPMAPASEMFYDADADAKNEAWVSRKFLQGRPDVAQRLSCPGCFEIVCFAAQPGAAPLQFRATRIVNCTVDRRSSEGGWCPLACAQCGAALGRAAAGAPYEFTCVLADLGQLE